MDTKLTAPRFQLQRIHADGSADEPELYSLTEMVDQLDTRVGRRGFLLSSALGAGTLAALSMGCRSAKTRPAKPQPPREILRNALPAKDTVQAQSVGSAVAHMKEVLGLAFSADGSLLATASADTKVKLWAMPSGKLSRTLKDHGAGLLAVAFVPGGPLLSVSGSGALITWAAPFDKAGKRQNTPERACRAASFSPDGKLAALVSSQEIEIRAMPAGTPIASRAYSGGTPVTAFSADGATLAVRTTPPATLALWATGADPNQTLAQWPGNAFSMAISPDGGLLATRFQGDLRLWALPSGEQRDAMAVARSGNHFATVFSADGRWLATSVDGGVLLFQPPFEAAALLLGGYSASVRSLAFSSDGKFLASGAADGSVWVWKLPEGAEAARLHAVLLDPEAIPKDVSIRQATMTSKSTYVGRCGDPLPAGAVCTCNCVPGRYVAPAAPRVPSGGSYGGSVCTCNKICTCVPIK